MNRADAYDDSDEPHGAIESVGCGDTICISGTDAHIISRGCRVNYGQRGLYRFTLRPDAFGVVASLFVDRDPYELSLCNGPVREIDPSEVSVR